MEHTVVDTIISADGTRRVEVFRRADGTFGFEDWKWDSEEDFWYVFGTYSHAVVDSLERAISEARSRVSWLATRDQT